MKSSLPRRTANNPKRTLKRVMHIGAPLFTYLVLAGCSSGAIDGTGGGADEKESLGSISQDLTTRYEAESASFTAGTSSSSGSASGGKYVDSNNGAKITWTLSGQTAGSATLTFATKNPSGTGRKMGVFVNSTRIGEITTDNIGLPFTVKNIAATLVSGNNTIELRDDANPQTGEPDVDYLEVITGGGGGGSCAPACAMGQNCVSGACQTVPTGYYNSGKSLGPTPDFGPNVKVYTPATSATTIQNDLNSIYTAQHTNQFGTRRDAVLFAPGTYSPEIKLGFNTQIAGLGDVPGGVTLSGWLHVDADWLVDPPFNGTQNFWRSVENFKYTHTAQNMRWAVSQAAPMRRVHSTYSIDLHHNNGWVSGGFMADCKIDGWVLSGPQQQWYTRNSHIQNWSGSNWNMMFQGVTGGIPANTFPNAPFTNIAPSSVVREKPFLFVDRDGKWNVFAPAHRNSVSGPTWTGTQNGTVIPLSSFYIAKSQTDNATSLNNALSQGKHLLLTPGIYNLSSALAVNNANTVILGLGLATLTPTGGNKAIAVADVDGVKIAGLFIDAGSANSPVLVEVGPSGSSASHSSNPTSLHDIFVRIGGGPTVGKATVAVIINSKNAIGDHFWLWRADHSDTPGVVGWTINTSDNGLIVNGSDVTIYGNFVEHFQKYQVVWNGNNGKNYFYQSELPYDPPNQSSWMNGTSKGWASYKVADSVTTHESWGMGIYAVFTQLPGMQLERAIEAPNGQANVKFRNMATLSLTANGQINNVINNNTGCTNGATPPTSVPCTALAVDFANYPRLKLWH